MVSVKEKKSKPITIVGAVARPMVYQADRPVTLIQVLAEAGGISADAGDTVIVTRGASSEDTSSNEPPEIGNDDAATAPVSSPSNPPPAAAQKSETSDAKAVPAGSPMQSPVPQAAPQAATPNPAATPPPITESDRAPLPNTITVNLSELLERGDTQDNIPLQGGDVVTVPHAGIVYALGAVQRPGGFVSSNDHSQLSTLKLLALAGGMTRIAKKDRAVIIRKDATGKQQSIPVDLAKIVNQKSEDVRLQPSDILYIPDNITKAVLLRAAEVALGVGTAVAIYRIGSR
jgi:protein involved in polysaccharide export with SLBB domain